MLRAVCAMCYKPIPRDTSMVSFTESNKSYHMSSFVETKALEQLTKSPVEFVEYPFCSLITVKFLPGILFFFFE